MTQVDFYILESQAPDARLTTACRIAEKATLRQQHVLINAESAAECARLDALLWTFSQGSFVPHRMLDTPEQTAGTEPVLIGCQCEPAVEPWDVLINLAASVPEFFSQYKRVAELVDGTEERRKQGRERFRFYKDRGYALNTHRI